VPENHRNSRVSHLEMRTANLAVVHLVRAANGVEPFRRFVASYRSHTPGIQCDLLIVFKGFPGNKVPSEYHVILEDTPHLTYFVGDSGYDILPYFRTAERYRHDAFCFLNSFSIILDNGWLRKLYTHLSESNVGIVGATGSWQSIYSDSLKWRRQGVPSWKRALATPFRMYLKAHFDPYPNYHVRTTAFMISRDTMLGIRHGGIRTKMSAWIFESGKDGLTKQILAAGKRVLIVGRDGRAYEKEEWIRSGIFWQGKQENLLVDDKQTQRYAQGDERECEYLRSYAWWDPMGPESGEGACVPRSNRL